MRKLRVLKISHTAALASYRARERALVSQFPVELEVVTPDHWPHLGSEDCDDAPERFAVHRIQTMGSGNIPLFALATNPLIRILKQFQPDVVDVHEEPYSVSGFEGVALVRHFAPQAALLFYTAQNIQKRYPPPFKWTEQFVYRSCAAAYPCSSEAAQVLKAKGFRGLTSVLPLGVDPLPYNPRVLSSAERASRRADLGLDGFVLGYFGRVESCKGIQVLFEAVSKLPKSLKFSLAIVGSGSYSSKLKELAQRLGISEHVHWLGEKTAGEIPRWLTLCDCVVIPSLTTTTWKEQFGRAAIEAMACGVPVVASDSGSLPEVVCDAGMTTREGDANELKECITKLIVDAALKQVLVEAGLRAVEEKYSWSRIAQQTFELYSHILHRNRSSGPLVEISFRR